MSSKVRQTLYLLGTLATTALTLAVTWNLVDPGQASQLTQLVTAALGLIGVTAGTTATVVVGKQRKEGQFDVTNPADSVINGVQTILQQSANAQADVEKVKQSLIDALGPVPVLGPLSQQIINSIPRL